MEKALEFLQNLDELDNQAERLVERSRETGDLTDISEAVSAIQRVVELSDPRDSNLAWRLISLGDALSHRFRCGGDVHGLDKAISTQERAIRGAPDNHECLPLFLSYLGYSFEMRFGSTNDVADIDKSISLHRRAVGLEASEGNEDLPSILNKLGTALRLRFQRVGQLCDITESIAVHERSVQLTPQDPVLLPAYLTNLGCSFALRFETTADGSDIFEAISAHRRAMHLAPDNMDILTNLGSTLACRFDHFGDYGDLSEAISAYERVVSLSSEGDEDLHLFLCNLGTAYCQRFYSTSDRSDIDEAISALQHAVCITPDGHIASPVNLCNLGDVLSQRFEHYGDLNDSTEAISILRRAVQLTPKGHAHLPVCLSKLGVSLTDRFRSTGDRQFFDEAISAHQQALELTPDGHAQLASRLNRLGDSWATLFTHTHTGDHFETGIFYLKSAAISSFGPPKNRLEAAQQWAHALDEHRPPTPDLLLAYDTIIGLTALIGGLDQTIRRRYVRLRRVSESGIGLQAAAAAFKLDQPDKALEWLEQGRCLVWSQLSNLRTPVDVLATHNSALAQRITDVSKQLEIAGWSGERLNTGLSMSEMATAEDDARTCLLLVRQWEELLREAREIPGFEHFLQPSPCSTLLQHLPTSGPIIVINVDEKRCDAIALLAGLDNALHIPLPNFSLAKAETYRGVLRTQLQHRGVRVREEDTSVHDDLSERKGGLYRRKAEPVGMRAVLRGLWDNVVKPILDGLGFSVSAFHQNECSDIQNHDRESITRLERHRRGFGGAPRAPCHSFPSTRRGCTTVRIPRLPSTMLYPPIPQPSPR